MKPLGVRMPDARQALEGGYSAVHARRIPSCAEAQAARAGARPEGPELGSCGQVTSGGYVMRFCRCIFFLTAMTCAVAAQGRTLFGTNLIYNGDAEISVGSTTGSVAAVAGWQQYG